MGRKRQDKNQPSDHDESAPGHRPRRGRKLALLVALAGAAAYLFRRNQRKAELDEGIWHEAPPPRSSSSPATPASTTPTA